MQDSRSFKFVSKFTKKPLVGLSNNQLRKSTVLSKKNTVLIHSILIK